MRSSTFLRNSGLVLLSTVAVFAFVGLSACGSGNGGATPSVSISPTQTSVSVGLTAQFLANVNNSSSNVIWQVNGTAGGNSTVGTIQADGANPLQGDYTAPSSVPASNPVSVTAVLQSNKNVVSNPASVSITAAQGLQVTPSSTNAIPGTNIPFSATLNGAPDNNVTWSLSTSIGGNPGTIGSTSGIYTPPLFPPPGAQVTVKAVDGNNSGTATVTVQYGNASLEGTYSFAYTGDDGSGFFTVAGSFTADGKGGIGGGVEDAEDLGGVNQAVTIGTGTYTVSTNGLTVINLTAGGSPVVLQAALNSNLHGLLIRYDNVATGSGTIDQQTTADFSNVSGPYVFSISGADAIGPNPLGLAGKFSASVGTIPNINAIVDVNDAGDVNGNNGTGAPGDPDTSLNGSYAQDLNNTSFGRGTITLNATNFGIFTTNNTLVFAYYVVDRTHLHLVEIDQNAFTSGDMYEGLLGPGFGVGVLAKGNYPFSLGGASNNGPYVAGGVFSADGAGNVSGGILDNNDSGTRINKGLTINKCGFGTGFSPGGVDPGTGRVDLLLGLSSGSGCGTPSINVEELALYPTALTAPSSVTLEIDNNFLTNGVAYAQQGSPVSPTGTFAFNLTGQGIAKSIQGQQDALAVLAFNGTAPTTGTFLVNNAGVPISGTLVANQSSLTTVSSSFGRGTMKFTVNFTPSTVYNLAYYYADPNTYLVIDLDTNRIANGIIADQF